MPGELAALVARMMAKEPEERFQTPAEVAEALTPSSSRARSRGPDRRPRITRGAQGGSLSPAYRRWVRAGETEGRARSGPGPRRLLGLGVGRGRGVAPCARRASVVIFKTRNGTIIFENLPEKAVVTVDGDTIDRRMA